MNKLFSFLAVGALLVGAAFTTPAPAQMTATAIPIGRCRINPDNYVAINLRGVLASPGPVGTFLPLPDTVATVNNGAIIQTDKAFVITDVRVSYRDGATGDFELMEANQGQTFIRTLLQEDSMLDGWQSSLGVVARGDMGGAMGLAIRAVNGRDPILLDVEIIGYARNN